MTEIAAAADVPPRLTDYETERASFRIVCRSASTP